MLQFAYNGKTIFLRQSQPFISLSAKSMLSQHHTQLWILFHMHNLIAKDLITEKSNVCSFIFNRWFNFVFKNDLENLCIKHESQTNLVILLYNSTDRRQNFAIFKWFEHV